MNENQITEQVIGAAIDVHKELGPGLFEPVYQECLAFELNQRHLNFDQQRPLSVSYKNRSIDTKHRLDLIVENKVVIELKAVEQLMPIHDAQLLAYLKLAQCKVGLLINFNVPLLHKGIKRLVNVYQA